MEKFRRPSRSPHRDISTVVALITLIATFAAFGTPQAVGGDHSGPMAMFEPDPGLPGGMSVWALLEAEAADAAAHAGFAVNHPTNLENIQRHTRHVRHSLDPAAEANRPMPGRDYGVIRAAKTMLRRLESAGTVIDASEQARATDGLHHMLALSDVIIGNCAAILAATTAEAATPLARANVGLLYSLIEGDRDGDGRLGLAQVKLALSAPD